MKHEIGLGVCISCDGGRKEHIEGKNNNRIMQACTFTNFRCVAGIHFRLDRSTLLGEGNTITFTQMM